MAAPSTYSLVCCDLAAREWGVGVQSKFLAAGSLVPWARAEIGALATQAYANPRYGPEGLDLLGAGMGAAEVVERLTAADEGRAERQLGVVDRDGESATFTGSGCLEWAGGRTGAGYAAQGNILAAPEVVDGMAAAFEATVGRPLAERILDALDAAQAAGGDRRGQQSAGLLVVRRDGGYAGLSDVVVDLRVDDDEQPLAELRRLYGLHQELFGRTPRERWIPVDAELRRELDERLSGLGYDRLEDWAGVENLEERVDGEDAIDPVVLAALRARSG
ncbi:MAG: DUF1028 domain-containing protein [Thermoleophilia bacterium]|nr:DUF1028 domain-containing protein [Thermoleophilia bacterium]